MLADSTWLAWDGGNLSARKRFDALQNEVPGNPGAAVEGLTALLADVRVREARIDVRHQLALAQYASGAEEHAAASMQDLVAEAPARQALVDDYAVMTYNLAQTFRHAGDLERALAYLLQSASLNAHTAARAAFDAVHPAQKQRRCSNQVRANGRSAHRCARRQRAQCTHPILGRALSQEWRPRTRKGIH